MYFSVVILKLRQGGKGSKVSLGNGSTVNHWFVDKINVITDSSDNEEEFSENKASKINIKYSDSAEPQKMPTSNGVVSEVSSSPQKGINFSMRRKRMAKCPTFMMP